MAKPMGISAERHEAIFGPVDDLMEEKTGKKRLCKTCGGWHRIDRPWPHNCRPPQRKMQHLPAPTIIGDIPAHRVGDEIIDGRRQQREFMARTGFVEHESMEETAGTHKQDFSSRKYEEELVGDIKRALEEDPLNRPPPVMIEEANASVDTAEEAVDTEGMEVIGDDHAPT